MKEANNNINNLNNCDILNNKSFIIEGNGFEKDGNKIQKINLINSANFFNINFNNNNILEQFGQDNNNQIQSNP